MYVTTILTQPVSAPPQMRTRTLSASELLPPLRVGSFRTILSKFELSSLSDPHPTPQKPASFGTCRLDIPIAEILCTSALSAGLWLDWL